MLRIALFAILSVGILLFFPSSSSILFPWVGGDYVVFRTIGDGWFNGLIPYKDLFDHKGPLMYLIQLVGTVLYPGKYGIWILELLCTVLILELIFRIGVEIAASKILNYISVLVALIFISAYIDGGNTVEQWSLPFQCLALLFFLRYFNKKTSLRWTALINGICFGSVALIRINDNCVICGIVAGMLIYFIRNKNIRDLLYSVLYFTLGILLALVPCIVYFAVHDALQQFIYCNFIFNVHYKAVWDGGFSAINIKNNLICLLPCIILMILVLYKKRVNPIFNLTFFLIALVTLSTFITGAAYSHYFLMAIPVAALCVQCSSRLKRYMKVLVFILVVAPVIYRNQGLPALRLEAIESHMASKMVLHQTEMFGCIPLAEADSVYAFGDFLVCSELLKQHSLPIGKYFFIQEKLATVDRVISDDIRDAFFKASPKWVVGTCDLRESDFFIGFDSLYDCVAGPDSNNEKCFIYRKKN